jgi:hypothetical protein
MSKDAWAAPPDADTDRYLTVEKLHQAARRAQRGGAADALGARISESFLDLLTQGSTEAKEAFRVFICKPYYTGAQPQGSPPPEILHTGTLQALSKSPKPGVRPIVIGSVQPAEAVREERNPGTQQRIGHHPRSLNRRIQAHHCARGHHPGAVGPRGRPNRLSQGCCRLLVRWFWDQRTLSHGGTDPPHLSLDNAEMRDQCPAGVSSVSRLHRHMGCRMARFPLGRAVEVIHYNIITPDGEEVWVFFHDSTE